MARPSSSATEVFATRVLIATGLGALVILLIAVFLRLAPVLLVVYGDGLFALLLDGLAGLWRQRLALSRGWSLVLTAASLLLVVAGFVWFAGAQISEQAQEMQQQVPAGFQRLRDSLMRYGWFRLLWSHAPGLDQLLQTGLLGPLGGAFTSTLGALGAFLLALVIGIYLVAEPQLYRDNALAIIPEAHRGRAREIVDATVRALRSWLVARFASMAFVGVLTTVGLALIGVPLALLLGIITALLSFIPFVGPVIAAVPAVLLGLVEGPATAVWILVIYVLAQAVEENLVAPLLERRAVRLPPAVILSSQLVMGVLFGFAGVVLSTPLAVAFVVLVQMLYVQDVLEEPARVLGPG